MGEFSDRMAVGPCSIPTEGELRAGECVDALHSHPHIRAKMPPVGLGPTTLAPAAQTFTQYKKWTMGGKRSAFTVLKRNGALPGGPGIIENGKCEIEIGREIRKAAEFLSPYFLFSIFLFLYFPRAPREGPQGLL